MIHHFKSYSLFYVLSLLFILVGLGSLLAFSSGDLIYWFNNRQNEELNFIFSKATLMGEWIGGTIVFSMLLFFFKYKYAILFLISILITSLTSQFLKQVVYPDKKRPAAFYEDLNEIPNIKKHKLYSFPSGHTTAAFTFFSFIAFAGRRKYWQFIAFFMASSVGISRVYLGQHFVIDVVAGAVLGSMLTAFIYIWIMPKLEKVKNLNKILIPV